MWNTKFKKAENIVSRFVAGETILVPIKGKLADMQKIFTLNNVANFIWQRLDGERNLSDILNDVMNCFDVERPQAENDIQELISELLKENLITDKG
ncbi:MAG: PqqD family protein [Nitrospirae bacterium]|jgi:hypothetical protein|nr:PqqD family protein [Nitrospirota bacterium]